MNSLGKRLRIERERLGLNQDALGVAPKTQRFYESGERSPDANYLEAFARLGADVRFILTGTRTIGELTPDEAALLDNYRAISEARKENLVDVAAALSQKQQSEKKTG
ncbi:MAG: helix-turn-helix transcriptional regulator [Ferribacterium limneticum]